MSDHCGKCGKGLCAVPAVVGRSLNANSIVDKPMRTPYILISPKQHTVAQKYPRPPITEAILHVRYGSQLTDGELERAPVLLRAEYPDAKEEADYDLQFEFHGPTGAARNPRAQVIDKGWRLLSASAQKTVVVRRSSVIFGYLAPYPGWDEFITSAHDVFDTIREKLRYRTVASVGLRYVNRLDIPVPSESELLLPSDYLTIGVSLPENKISNRMRGFTVVTDVDVNHDQIWARVHAGTMDPALIKHASLVFDIDIIAERGVPAKQDEFWALVERMRSDKNEIFESCLTDKARALFR